MSCTKCIGVSGEARSRLISKDCACPVGFYTEIDKVATPNCKACSSSPIEHCI